MEAYIRRASEAHFFTCFLLSSIWHAQVGYIIRGFPRF